MTIFRPLLCAAILCALASTAHAESASDKAFAAANDKMMADMEMKPTGDADKDFVAMMIPHHQGAVDMAKVELQYGKDKKLRTLAEKIVKAQEKEISFMQKWQKDHAAVK